jgi:hypothetical protein
MQLQKATRKKSKLRLNLSGPAGSGKKKKSMSAKLHEAVRTLHYYGFISEFERDSFRKRFETIKK